MNNNEIANALHDLGFNTDKIMVRKFSDRTEVWVLEKFGWKVIDAKKLKQDHMLKKRINIK